MATLSYNPGAIIVFVPGQPIQADSLAPSSPGADLSLGGGTGAVIVTSNQRNIRFAPGGTAETTLTITTSLTADAALAIPTPAPGAEIVLTSGAQNIPGDKTFSGTVAVTGTLSISGAFAVGGQLATTATTNQLALGATTISAPGTVARTFTLPDPGADAGFVMTAGNYTIAGAIHFTGTVTIDTLSITNISTPGQVSSTATSLQLRMGSTILSAPGTAVRLLTIPDPGVNTEFVMAAGDRSLGGTTTMTAAAVSGTLSVDTIVPQSGTSVTVAGIDIAALDGELTNLEGRVTNAETDITNAEGDISANTSAITALDNTTVKLSGNQVVADNKAFSGRIAINRSSMVGIAYPLGIGAQAPDVDGRAGVLTIVPTAGNNWNVILSGAESDLTIYRSSIGWNAFRFISQAGESGRFTAASSISAPTISATTQLNFGAGTPTLIGSGTNVFRLYDGGGTATTNRILEISNNNTLYTWRATNQLTFARPGEAAGAGSVILNAPLAGLSSAQTVTILPITSTLVNDTSDQTIGGAKTLTGTLAVNTITEQTPGAGVTAGGVVLSGGLVNGVNVATLSTNVVTLGGDQSIADTKTFTGKIVATTSDSTDPIIRATASGSVAMWIESDTNYNAAGQQPIFHISHGNRGYTQLGLDATSGRNFHISAHNSTEATLAAAILFRTGGIIDHTTVVPGTLPTVTTQPTTRMRIHHDGSVRMVGQTAVNVNETTTLNNYALTVQGTSAATRSNLLALRQASGAQHWTVSLDPTFNLQWGADAAVDTATLYKDGTFEAGQLRAIGADGHAWGTSGAGSKMTAPRTGTLRTYTLPEIGAGTSANVVVSTGAQTIAGALTLSSQLTLSAATNQLRIGSNLTINAPAAPARTYTIPVVAGTSTEFMMTAGAQTVAGVKTYSDQLVLDAATPLRFGASLNIAYEAGATRTYTIPQVGPAANFMMTAGAQTAAGVKTFSNDIIASTQVQTNTLVPVSGDLTVINTRELIVRNDRTGETSFAQPQVRIKTNEGPTEGPRITFGDSADESKWGIIGTWGSAFRFQSAISRPILFVYDGAEVARVDTQFKTNTIAARTGTTITAASHVNHDMGARSPYMGLYSAPNIALPNNVESRVVPFGGSLYHYKTAYNGTHLGYVVEVPGIYEISARCIITATAAGGTRRFGFRIDEGSTAGTIQWDYYNNSDPVTPPMVVSMQVTGLGFFVTTNTNLKIYAYQNTGGSANITHLTIIMKYIGPIE